MKLKRFLFVSKDSLSGDLAVHLLNEGHDVRFYFEDKYSKDVYDGFIEKVSNWKKYLRWADVIIFDDENFGHYADKLRKRGKLVIGGSRYTDKLEIDRDFGRFFQNWGQHRWIAKTTPLLERTKIWITKCRR